MRTWKILLPAFLALLQIGGASQEKKKFTKADKKQIEDWTVWVDQRLLKGDGKAVGDRALEALKWHLYKISQVVREDRLVKMKKLEIRIELNNPGLSSMQYHPGLKWLVKNGHDPTLVKQVHIPNARELYSKRTLFKHPWVVLHELAHSYHDQVLGFNHKTVVAAYKKAVADKKYESVLLFTGRKVRHYALTDHKEYFAELTEAYFAMNDFYPFINAELKEHDPTAYKTLVEIWGKRP